MPVIDHRTLKLSNQLLILNTLREKGALSRNQLKAETALSWGTITAFVKELLDEGILTETGKEVSDLGRKPMGLDLNTQSNHVVGVRLGGTSIKAVILDVRGKILHEHQAPTNPHADCPEIIRQIMTVVDEALTRAGIQTSHLAGIGFTAPGAIDAAAGICLYAPRHPSWRNVPIRDILKDRYQIPCFVEHSNNSSALGEQWFGAGMSTANFLCVPIGDGISVGIIIHGQIYRGHDSMAGEFGHTCIDPAGPTCVCGRKGCLEEYASGRALTRQAARADREGRGGGMRALIPPEAEITPEVLFQAAKAKDAEARKIFQTMGCYLGIGLANLINLFNPELIIISGGVARSSRFFLSALKQALHKHAWNFSSQKIVVSRLDDPVVLGAASLVLREIYRGGLLFKKAS